MGRRETSPTELDGTEKSFQLHMCLEEFYTFHLVIQWALIIELLLILVSTNCYLVHFKRLFMLPQTYSLLKLFCLWSLSWRCMSLFCFWKSLKSLQSSLISQGLLLWTTTYCSIFSDFENIIYSQYLTLLFPPSKSSHISTSLFFINCYFMHVCICTFIYINITCWVHIVLRILSGMCQMLNWML